jgi:hypothetical protein
LESLRGDNTEDVCSRIILKWILGVRFQGMDEIHLAHDMDCWWALVKKVMNTGFHKRQGLPRLAYCLPSQGLHCSAIYNAHFQPHINFNSINALENLK